MFLANFQNLIEYKCTRYILQAFIDIILKTTIETPLPSGLHTPYKFASSVYVMCMVVPKMPQPHL